MQRAKNIYAGCVEYVRAFAETTEKLSHGEPTFFVRKNVFAMFANNHHNDGHIAVWIPAEPGAQASLVAPGLDILQASVRWRARLGRDRIGPY